MSNDDADAPLPGAPLRGGRLECVMLGHRWQRRDADNARDHVEYVLRLSWRPDAARRRAANGSLRLGEGLSARSGGGLLARSGSLSGSFVGSLGGSRRGRARGGDTRVWLVARRFRDFRALHRELRRAGAAPLPRFPSRHGLASLVLGRNRRDAFVASRERTLERYLAALLAAGPAVLDAPAADELLELSARLGAPPGRPLGDGRDRRNEEDEEDEGDRDFFNAEWLDYQLKLRLMELLDDGDGGGDGRDAHGTGRERARTLAESVELLRPQLKRAARVPERTAQATLVLKKFADSLAILDELRQRELHAQRRDTR